MLIQARQDMLRILGRRTVHLLQLVATVIAPLSDAIGGYFQVALKSPMRAQAKAFIQAMRAGQRPAGPRRNLKSVVMPVEQPSTTTPL